MAALKTCLKCGAEKPRTEFYPHPQMADGLLGKCKRCARLDARSNRGKRYEYYLEYDRARCADPARKAMGIASFRAAADKHPERTAAARITYNAVKRGEIKRQPCWVCGDKAEAHHPDYSRPLDVVWLCLVHHRQAHGIARRIDNEDVVA